MKKLNLMLFVAFSLIVLATGCKKDPDLTEIIQGGKWKLTAQTEDGVDSYKSMAACEKDDLYSFTTDNKYVVDEGATKCAATDPQSQTVGTYTVSADEKTISIKYDTFSITLDFKVLEATETSLKLETTFLGSTTVGTFAKQ